MIALCYGNKVIYSKETIEDIQAVCEQNGLIIDADQASMVLAETEGSAWRVSK